MLAVPCEEAVESHNRHMQRKYDPSIRYDTFSHTPLLGFVQYLSLWTTEVKMVGSRIQHSSSLKPINPMGVLQPFCRSTYGCRKRKLSIFIPSRPRRAKEDRVN